MKTKNIKKRVAAKSQLPNGAKRFPGTTSGNSAKALQVATEQQVDEMERTFSSRWEW